MSLTDAAYDVQAKIVAKITAYKIFDGDMGVPDNQDYPYITYHARDNNVSTLNENRQDHIVDLHIWDRYHGKKTVLAIKKAILTTLAYDGSLHESGYTQPVCYYESWSCISEPINEVVHGVLTMRIITCQN
jgi:hypothetical protein